jgi:ribosomal protein S18 acetylase RimI-like enzyme
MTPSEPAGTRAVTVRPMRDDDLHLAARLHAQALPHGFFGRLGPVFLRPYYRSFLTGPSGVALVAEVDGTPVGVLVGTTRPGEHYRWALRRHGARLALALVAGLLGSPRQLVLFLRTRVGRYARAARRLGLGGARAASAEPPAGSRRLAVLTHVCVSPQARGSGAGTALVEAFCARAREDGRMEAQLVTLAGPEGASLFYDRLGWRRRGERLDHDGRPVRSYAKAL